MERLTSLLLLTTLICWSRVCALKCPSKCKCEDKPIIKVDCRGAGLTAIPKLPSETEVLDLSDNALHQLSDKSFSSTPILKTLFLSKNGLTRIEIDAFVGLGELRTLNLSHNSLNEDNFRDHELLRGCRGVTELDVSNNLLTQIPKDGFKVLTKLKRLRLANNVISDPNFGPAYIVMEVLESVDLSGNRFSEIPSTTFKVLTSLKAINLSGCGIRRIRPGVFRELRNIVEFDISNNEGLNLNNLNETITAIGQSPLLSKLRLSKLNISDLNNVLTPLTSAENLKDLDLSRNALQQLPHAVLRSVKSVKKLDLSYNKLVRLPTLSLPNLQQLDISHNMITTVNEQNFEVANKLEELDLSYNQLTEFESGAFSRNYELKRLDLSFNKIEQIAEVSSLELLEKLSLRGNSITVPANLFKMMGLKSLDLGLNKIRSFGRSIIENKMSLLLLNLTANEITDIERNAFAVWTPPTVDLSHNKLRSVDNWGFGLIRKLYLQSNQIEHIREDSLDNAKFLEHLDLSDNRLNSLPSTMLKSLSNLLWLNLGSNSLGAHLQGNSGLFPSHTELTTLILRSNNIDVIAPRCFANLTVLRHLDLSKNRIADVTSGQFHELGMLKSLNLSQNKLTGFNSSAVASLVSLTSLDLSGTQWQCNCALADVKRWMESTKIDLVNYELYRCAGPQSKAKLLLKDFDVGDTSDCNETVMEQTVILIIIGCTAFVILVVSAIIFWQHRWRLKKKLKKQHYRAMYERGQMPLPNNNETSLAQTEYHPHSHHHHHHHNHTHTPSMAQKTLCPEHHHGGQAFV